MEITSRHVKGGVSQHSLQNERVHTLADGVRSEAVPERMERAGGRLKTECPAESLDISQNIASALLRAVPRPEHQSRLQFAPSLPDKQPLPQFERHGHDPVLASLAVESQEKVFKIYVRPTQGEKFVDSATRITESSDQCLQPMLECRAGSPVHQPCDLCRVEGRKHSLVDFHFGYDGGEFGPSTVRLDRLQTTSYGDWFQPSFPQSNNKSLYVLSCRGFGIEPTEGLFVPLDRCGRDVVDVLAFFDELLVTWKHGSSRHGVKRPV